MKLPADVRHPPVGHGGYLWTISTSAAVIRLSPGDQEPVTVNEDRPEYGKGPFAVVAGDGAARPLIVTVGTRRIAIADPSASTRGRFSVFSESLPSPQDYRDEQGRWFRRHYFLPAISLPHERMASDGYPAVACSGPTVAAMTREDGQDRLAVWQRGEPVREHDLPEKDLTGPFPLSGRTCLYSANAFYWLEGETLRHREWPSGFRPVASNKPFAPLLLPLGRPPFVALESVAFLPGRIGEQPGFLGVDWSEGHPRFLALPVTGSDGYQAGGVDRLLIASTRRLLWLSRNGLSTSLAEASSIVPGPALAHAAGFIACCRVGRGELELRAFPDGSERVTIPDGATPIELFLFPGFLTLTALAAGRLEVLSWPLE